MGSRRVGTALPANLFLAGSGKRLPALNADDAAPTKVLLPVIRTL